MRADPTGEPGSVELFGAEGAAAAAIGEVRADALHIEALQMVAALERELGIIHRAVEIDHGGHFRFGCFVRPGVVDQKAAGAFGNNRDLRDIGGDI